MNPPVAPAIAGETSDERFSRFRLIPWWDQARIRQARIVVLGAGALGNEILKSLALLGFANIVVVDMDRVERSNLSRAVLFRAEDEGEFKASVAALAVRRIAPECLVQPLVCNAVHGVGLGVIAWADVVMAGVDNREARLWLNRAAWKTGRPWVDGAIEGINGLARVFLPGVPPCYECTLGETDWAILQNRLSCNLLRHEAQPEGKVPTTPTVSSVIAGVQVQEAVKLLHTLPVLAGKAFIFEGLQHTSYVVSYTEAPDCSGHHVLDLVHELPDRSSELTLDDLHGIACALLHEHAVTLEFSRDIIHKLVCPGCGREEERFEPLGAIRHVEGQCPADGEMRAAVTVHAYRGNEAIGSRRLDELGLPPFDIYIARAGENEIGLLIAGDASDVLGPLAPRRST